MKIKNLLGVLSFVGMALAGTAACSNDDGSSSDESGTGTAGTSAGAGGFGGAGGGAAGNVPICPASPASAVFANALCLCGDFKNAGALHTRSTGNGPASVGVNGATSFAAASAIEGSFAPYGGLTIAGATRVDRDLTTTKNISGAGTLSIGHDLNVGGTLNNLGVLEVGGTLRAVSNTSLGLQKVAGVGSYAAPAAPPCPCDASKFLDVQSWVNAIKAKNDNAANGFGPSMLSNIGAQEVTLKTGSYFLGSALKTIGATRFIIDGAVSLAVDGDVDLIGAEQIKINKGSTLDFFISGALRNAGATKFGDGTNPGAFRMYVGAGDNVVLVAGAQAWSGLIYAPRATMRIAGATALNGSLFGDQLSYAGAFELGYFSPSFPGADKCTSPAGSGGLGGSGGGPGGTGGTGGTGTGDIPPDNGGFVGGGPVEPPK